MREGSALLWRAGWVRGKPRGPSVLCCCGKTSLYSVPSSSHAGAHPIIPLFLQCWAADPNDRPTASAVRARLLKLLAGD